MRALRCYIDREHSMHTRARCRDTSQRDTQTSQGLRQRKLTHRSKNTDTLEQLPRKGAES